ncbi:MAG: outer membrane protein transport protein [Deltaproteobacteria bacterium]|nr:outer membrane protein transport protein [Deltaproteobacteria bacterium]
MIGTYVGLSHASGVDWPTDWYGRFDSTGTAVRALRIAPFFGWRFGPIRVAAGPHIDFVRLGLRRRLDMVDQESRFELEAWGVGLGGDVSIFAQPIPELTLGLSYKSRTALTLEGDVDFDGTPLAFEERTRDQHASTEMTLPDRIAVGAGLHLGRVSAYLDVALTLWSVRERLRVDFENDATPDVNSPQNWHEAVNVRAGVEWRLHRLFEVRAGVYLDPTAAPDDTLAPTTPDMTRLGFSIGGSVSPVGWLAFDVHYEHVRLLGRDTTSPDAVLAHYSGYAHVLGIGARVHVDPAGGRNGRPRPASQ